MIMRKNYQMWLLGALFGGLVLPFAGCSNEDDPTPNGPGSGETFETELSIALTAGSGAKTKATDKEIQNAYTDFNGVSAIKLISYSNNGWVGEGITLDNFGAQDASTVISVRDLESIDANITPEKGMHNYVTKQQTISLDKKSQGFLFYGQSAYNNQIGKLIAQFADLNETVSGTSFELESLADPNYKVEMEDYLRGVYNALYILNPDYVVDDGTPDPLYGSLNSATSGSFMQIADLMAQLYVMAATLEPSGNTLTTAIMGSGEIFTSTPTGTYVPAQDQNPAKFENLQYTADGSLSKILSDANLPAAYYNLDFCDHGDGTSATFLTESRSNIYASPAALYYYVNSYPVSYDGEDFNNLSWQTELGTLATYVDLADLGEVTPSKIAIAHSVQYGVGRLDVSLKSADELSDIKGNVIKYSDFELRGILIGNQKQVGWNFMPNGQGDQKVIYDNVVGKALYTDENADGYDDVAKVLALPTANGEDVRIALEFYYSGENTQGEFIGANGQKIPKGSIFYVAGLLRVNDATNSVADNVFVSDYRTTARLTLNSVKSAENTVPDLSGDDSDMEFALSVDLDWEAGLNFDVEIGDDIP